MLQTSQLVLKCYRNRYINTLAPKTLYKSLQNFEKKTGLVAQRLQAATGDQRQCGGRSQRALATKTAKNFPYFPSTG
jgi:hypothetical protein